MIVGDTFPLFTDTDGDTLEAGKVYIGTVNLNPETNPINVYWDSGLTELAAQPLRTNGGRIVRNGAVSNIYTSTDYSITVKDQMDTLVYYFPDSSKLTPTIAGVSNITVSTIAELKAVPKLKYSQAFVEGYYARGDGGGGNYYYDSSDVTSLDNGGTIIVATDGARWKLLIAGSNMVSVKQFGAKGDDATNDTAAIQSAIDAVIGVSKVLIFPPGTYQIDTTLTVGDGTSTTPSTKNGLDIVGSGSGVTGVEIGPSGSNVVIKWTGAALGTMLSIAGPIYGININAITFDCNTLAATGINSKHIIGSSWVNIVTKKYTNGVAYIWGAYPTPITGIAVGSSDNVFQGVHAKQPGSGGSGFKIGETTAPGILNVARNTWIGCHIGRDGLNAATYSMQLSFVDNCTFIECNIGASYGSLGIGLYVADPVGAPGFPGELLFSNCPIDNTTVSGTYAPDGGITMFPFPIGDGELTPVAIGKIRGLKADGQWFGGFAFGNGAQITGHLSVTGPLTFGAVSANSTSDQLILVPGCAIGDTVVVSCSDVASLTLGGMTLHAYVAAAGSVSVRWSNCGGVSRTPTAGATYRVDIWQH